MTDEIEVEKTEDSFIFKIVEKEETTNLRGEKVTLEEEKTIEIPKNEDVASKIIKVLGKFQLSNNPPPCPKSVSQKMDEVYDR